MGEGLGALDAPASAEAPAGNKTPPGRKAKAPDGGGDKVVLYEIYDDDAAFAAHMETPHFAAFRDAIADLEESRRVGKYRPRNNET